MDIGERHNRISEKVQQMCLMHDSFMSAVLQDTECCEVVVNIILNRNDIKVSKSYSQYSIQNLRGRSVKLDIFATDSDGKVYNIEIQRADAGAVPQRARYNSSIIDANISAPGEKYTDIPETYVIFITENDIIGKGKPLYTIERVIKETGDEFGDGSHILYVNAGIQDETPLGQLMADFNCVDPHGMKNKVLAERADYFKNNKEGNRIMCKIVEELVNEEREDIEKKANIDTACRMIEKGKYSVEEIAEMSNLLLDEVEKLVKEHSA